MTSVTPDAATLLMMLIGATAKHTKLVILLILPLISAPAAMIASRRPVLLEHSHANGHIGGFTDNYLRVSVDAPASADNSIVDVRLGAYLPESESMEASVVAR